VRERDREQESSEWNEAKEEGERESLSLLIKPCSYLVQSSLDSPRDKSARSSPLVHRRRRCCCCCSHRTRVDRYSELTFSTLEWITKRTTRRTKRSRPPRFDDSKKYRQRTPRLPISRIRFCGSSLTSRTRAEVVALLLLPSLDWWFWSPCVARVSLSLFSLSLSLSFSLSLLALLF
jgi:hypothetical protein